MKHSTPLLLAGFLLAIAACSQTPTPEPVEETAESSSIAAEASSVRETQNVSYQGRVETLGPGIVMQGTHQLRLSDARIVLLESKDIDLNRYIGKRVGVFGATRPTVEGASIIMRVEEVILLENDPADEAASSVGVGDASSAGSSVETASSSIASSSRAASVSTSVASMAAVPPAASSALPASAPASADGSTATPSNNDAVTPEMQARSALMAKDKMSAENWTQKYCTSHIGFCIPVHRNWWFKSFGTTSSALWHVEVSNAEIQSLGEGTITVRLLSGNVASKKATDGQVRIQGNWVIAFKAWGDSEHFEIMAPAGLKTAVEYMTANLTAQE